MNLEEDHVLQGTISRKRCCLCGIAILGEFEMPLWMCQFHTGQSLHPHTVKAIAD
jgi:hypothetical protein